MHVQDNSKPSTRLLFETTSRRGMKPVLLVLGVSGLAALGAGVIKNWEPIEAVSGAMVQTVFAALGARQDQPAQAAAADSSRETVSASDVATAAATLVEPIAATPAAAVAERSKIANATPDVLPGGLFGIGDRLKIAFYERVDVEEDKWGRAASASALRGILQRPELSGEYTVQEDGTISVPLLGSIRVANRSPLQVRTDLSDIFDQLLGRKGVVNILSLERSPIYVLGPVKNPGSFKYASGMTILHAMALAGGLDRSASEPWQKIEAVREIQKRSGAVDAMLKLLARSAVLKAERGGTEPKIPLRLLELVGATEAANLVQEQTDRRRAVATARTNRERALQSALEAAKQDVVVYGRLESLDDLVKLRQDRVNSMRALVDRNVLSVSVLNQVQSELSDAEQRRRDALNQYATAKQRLATLEAEGFRIRADVRNDLELEIETIERQIADNEREFNISEGVLSVLPATRAQFTKEANRVSYQIVRQTTAGPISIESVGTALLQPGDLVNVIMSDGEPKDQAVTPLPTSPPGDRLSVGRAANRPEAGRAVADQTGPK